MNNNIQECTSSQESALNFLNELVGSPFRYGLKSKDLYFYDFGFGDWLYRYIGSEIKQKITTYAIHAQCEIHVIPRDKLAPEKRDRSRTIGIYSGDTAAKVFHKDMEKIYNNCIKRIGLSSKNDLWLDLGEYWIVFVTFENDKESWRFLPLDDSRPQLIASAEKLIIR